ncbi:MAG: hypothetical protein ACKVT0_08825 [Planctomycetaceae bacterium]
MLMVITCVGLMSGPNFVLGQTPGRSAGRPSAQQQPTPRPKVAPKADTSNAVTQYDRNDAPLPAIEVPQHSRGSSSIPESYKSYWGEKIDETPYGTINGKPYRPAPDDYYTRPRILHPQAVRGWGYDVNAANHGPDYSSGIVPSHVPVPARGSNVTFNLPDGGAAVPQSSYGAGHGFGETVYGGGVSSGYESYGFGSHGYGSSGYGSKSYMANYNWPNSADSALVPAHSDPVNFHFRPGLHRSGVSGHYRFPYYSYRRPWYHPGDASFQRNTQFPW